MKRGRIKIIFYLVSFSVSLYSISRVLDPIISIASGHPEDIKGGLFARLLPGLIGGESLDLSGITGGEGGLSSVDDIFNSLKQQGGDQTASSAGTDLQNLLSRVKSTASPSSKSGGTGSARIIRNTRATPVKKMTADEIAMTAVDSRVLDPDVEKSLRESAISLHTQGKIEEAIAAYQKAIAASPKRSGLHRNLALAYFQIGNYTNAWDEVHATRQLNGTIPDKFLHALGDKMSEPIG